MVQAVQHTSPTVQPVCPSCPNNVENKPASLQELFNNAREIARDFQHLMGEAGHTFENKMVSLESAIKQLSEEVEKGLSNGVSSMQNEFFRVLAGLNDIFEGARPTDGRVGGPSTVHPNAFKAQIESLKEQVAQTKPETKEEAEALAILQESLSQFVPAYEAYLGAGVQYPSEGNEEVRYVNAKGDEITKAEFDQIREDFRLALESTTNQFLTDVVERVRSMLTTTFENISDTANNISI